MTALPISRPVVRSFKPRYLREAAAHVRAGGHAVVWESPSRARLVVQKPKKGDEGDLGYWAILDLGKHRYKVADNGSLRGLATMLVPKDSLGVVERRIERDSIHPGSTHVVELDCLECGACCRDNRVILEPVDVTRFVAAGRANLAKRPYAKRDDGKVVLVLRKDKDCKHLASDNRCGIYEIRPDACSSFPMASECCLYAREEEMGIVDGLREGA